MTKLAKHLAKLPEELGDALESEFSGLAKHIALGEWDDAEVDAGCYSEAVLRVLEWQMDGVYTPIDGQQKPNRKKVTGRAASSTTLAPSLRFQIPALTELLMDFRNNRNAAHLGSIDPGSIDGSTVHQMASWILAELVRLYGEINEAETQSVLNELAMRPIPLVYEVAGIKLVLSESISAKDKTLLLLSSEGGIAQDKLLAKWCEYKNVTRFKGVILKDLASRKMIHINGSDVHLLPPGNIRANEISSIHLLSQ